MSSLLTLTRRISGTKLLSCAISSIVLLLSACPAMAGIKLTDPIPVNPDLNTGTLANGLRYYIQKNDTPRKKVELRLVVKAGSVLEDDDQQGLAHFTEHMAFNGSRHFKKHQLISYLQSIGVKFGADLNAYTSFDETVYVLPIPTDKKSYLKTGFQVLADWAQGVEMKAADIDKERSIILEEARLGKGVSDRISKQLMPEVFNGSKYAERMPIGKEDIIQNFKHDALRRFYKDWYRPDLMAVMVIGDVEPAEAEKMVRTYFSGLQNPQPSRPRPEIVIPKSTSSKSLVITDKEAGNNMLMLRYPLEKQPAHNSIADYRQDIIRNMYQGMLSRRLGALTDLPKPPFLGASAGSQPVVNGYESFISTAVISPAGTAAAITALIQEKNRVRQFGFTADELDRARKIEAREYESIFNERNKSDSATFAAEYIRNFLHDEPIPGIKNEYLYFKEFSGGITLEEMNQFARDATPDDSTRLVFYVGSNKSGETIPSNTELLEMARLAEQQQLEAKPETAVKSSLMSSLPTPGKIIAEKENRLLGTIEWTLSNGVKVTVKKTDFKNDQVLLSARRFGGMSLYNEDDKFNAWYSNSIVWGMGLGNFSQQDISNVLAGKDANVRTTIDNYTELFSGSSSKADIEAMLQLLYLRMTSPRKDEAVFQSFIAAQKQQARNNMSTPESVFWEDVKTARYGNHPRILRTAKVEDFDHVNMERSLEIFQQRYGSAKDLHFVIVGSVDVDKLRPLVATYLASLPVTDVKTSFEDLHIEPVSGIVKKEVHAGDEQKSIVSISFGGLMTYSREENSRFYAMLDILNLKIIDVLREKQGLIYSGGASGGFHRTPHAHYDIDLTLPCSPENAEKVVAALFGEIQKLQKSGPQIEDLNKVKQSWLKDNQQELRSNENWLNHLQTAVLYQTDPESILSTEKRIKALSPGQIKDAAKRYFDFNNYVQVVMYPEEKKVKE
ncbi:M16 family metallopeptidase [Undibacterium sp. TS12]|uniref:M16 family metallopeptidase n=1 Tax=Undibacterium sp. TS12 TaxID=2908202 RepID=UPI001F4C5B3E|nr:M16 family metallopeptidase [Undibacterium sp. TS12]MCH8619701.1 insulinase family protein [Undibacterium sp. TS12]